MTVRKRPFLIILLSVALLCVPLHFYSFRYYSSHSTETALSVNKINYLRDHFEMFQPELERRGLKAEVRNRGKRSYLVLTGDDKEYWYDSRLSLLTKSFPPPGQNRTGEALTLIVSFFEQKHKRVASVAISAENDAPIAWNHYWAPDFKSPIPSRGDYWDDHVEIAALITPEQLRAFYQEGLELEERLEAFYMDTVARPGGAFPDL